MLSEKQVEALGSAYSALDDAKLRLEGLGAILDLVVVSRSNIQGNIVSVLLEAADIADHARQKAAAAHNDLLEAFSKDFRAKCPS